VKLRKAILIFLMAVAMIVPTTGFVSGQIPEVDKDFDDSYISNAPPEGFSALTATDEELEKYGVKPRPKNSDELSLWTEEMKHIKKFVKLSRKKNNYELITANEEKVNITPFYDGVINFENLPNKFYQTSNDINQLGKAFLSRPQGHPEESIENKLLNSGLFSINASKDKPYYTFDSYFIKSYSCALFNSISLANSISLETESIEKWTYFYYGETIYVTLYEGYVTIETKSEKLFYEIEDVGALIQYRSYI